MKKLIIAALFTASTSSAFAIDHMLINGKKVTMDDTHNTLTQKLGKPSSNGKGVQRMEIWQYPGLCSLWSVRFAKTKCDDHR